MYEEEGKIVVDSSRYLYMSQRRGSTVDEIITQHNLDRQRESIDMQIERLKEEKAKLN